MPEGTFEGDINLMAEMAFISEVQYKDEALGSSPNGDGVEKRNAYIPDGYGYVTVDGKDSTR